MRPTACPRCARASETWTFERDQGIAGCPCGEVIPYAFDDAPLDAISKTPRKPRQWSEDARTNGFTATLRPSGRWAWVAVPLMFLFGGTRLAVVGLALGGATGLILMLAAVAAVIAWFVSQTVRRWTFRMEGGRFRAEARGHVTDIPLTEIQRFDVVRTSPKEKPNAADARCPFQLVVSRTGGERTRVPLFVESADQAQFVAERANALLATDGRTIDGDYRGNHVRIADVASSPPRSALETSGRAERAEVAELELGVDDRDDGVEAEPRRRHLGGD